MGIDEFLPAGKVLVVVAHADDETIGAGGLFPDLASRLTIVHVTDSAPRDMDEARAAGYAERGDYAAARLQESMTAAALAGIEPRQFLELGVADQEASHELVGLAGRLMRLFERERPDVVMTHPYEGGHPDHDATAFAVHAAAALLKAPPVLWEFTSYHAGDAGTVTGRFLGGDCGTTCVLTEERRGLKRRMFECFATQQEVMAWFTVGEERFRRAPSYDFTTAPHEGRLHYENFEWGMTGERFRAAASAALEALGLGHAPHHS